MEGAHPPAVPSASPSQPLKQGVGLRLLVPLMLAVLLLGIAGVAGAAYVIGHAQSGSSLGLQAVSETPTPTPTATPTPTPTPPPQPRVSVTVSVSATVGWQNSGVSVNGGDRVVIRYISGLWTDQSGTIPPYDAAGDPSGYTCTNYLPASQCVEPLPDAVKGSLIGEVGTQLYKVGDYLSFTATGGGSLFLRMNDSDDGLSDNAGSVTIQILVY